MNIGTLNMQCEIQARSAPVKDAEGGEGTSMWATFALTWCKINPQSGAEYDFFQQQQTKAIRDVVVRYIVGVKPEMRVIVSTNDGPIIFNIVRVDNMRYRQRYMRLWCTEVAELSPA